MTAVPDLDRRIENEGLTPEQMAAEQRLDESEADEAAAQAWLEEEF